MLATLPLGTKANVQLYVNVPRPLGFVVPLPFSVTFTPTLPVWSGPAFATGATYDQVSALKPNVTVRSTRMVNVFRLFTTVFVAAGEKCRFPIPGTTVALESELVTVSVMEGSAGPTFTSWAL